MASHTNFNHIIETLILLKDRYKAETPLTKHLKTREYSYRDEMEEEEVELPTNSEIATLLNIPRQKINKELRELYDQVIRDTYTDPLPIKEVWHTLLIHIPYDELRKKNTKRIQYDTDEQSLRVRLKLHQTQRVGETVDLSFIENSKSWNRGYVHEVTHQIHPEVHEILVWVHPFHNYFYKWRKMKDEHENWLNYISRSRQRELLG